MRDDRCLFLKSKANLCLVVVLERITQDATQGSVQIPQNTLIRGIPEGKLPIAQFTVVLFFEALYIGTVRVDLVVTVIKNMFRVANCEARLVGVVFIVATCNQEADQFLSAKRECS